MWLARWMWILGVAGCARAPSQRIIDETVREVGAIAAPALPRQSGAPDDFVERVARDELVRVAIARDPEIAVRVHRLRGALRGARAERYLPSPEIEASVWYLPLDRPWAFGNAQMYMLELRQNLPAHGSLDARARAAAEEARAVLGDIAERERDVARRASDAYADYVRAIVDHRIHAAQSELLDGMLASANARVASGGGTLREVARFQLETARLHRDVERVEGDLMATRSAINTMLLRDLDAPLGPPTDLEPRTARVDLDEAVSLAERMRGVVHSAASRRRAADARVDAARADANWPAFMLAATFWETPGIVPGIGASVGMTLPWLWGATRGRLDEALEMQSAEQFEARAAAVQVRGEVGRAFARVRALVEQWVTLRTETEPAARRALDAIRDAYLTGGAASLDWIDAARAWLDIEMDENGIAADLAHAVDELEFATGSEIPRVALTVDRGGSR